MEEEDQSHQPGDAGNIQAIDKQSVHRICSGQVVLNLATAVKELVENSLDAGAKSIDIRLREYGSEMLEVVDNGCGVREENFEGLTLKHHTSKLQDFSDLVSVDTFGFRGEALSSLCALSKLIITTCHKDTSVGTRLEFDHSGKLLSKTPSARQTGTTVSLQNVFSTLPVRHKEFLRNLKKEFNKMIQVLYAYCIISTAVRIHCTNQATKGKKNVMVSTNGNNTIKENIANLFGAKQMQNVLEFIQIEPSENILTEYRIPPPTGKVFSISGFVSTCEHGQGRGSTDRQFYFINKRPCDLVKVSRVVNEVYHSYNRHQYPFVVLDISLDKESVDVNVTPDKRQIFIENEKLLLAVIKSSLVKLWEPKASLFQLNQAQTPDQTPLAGTRPKLQAGESSRSSPNLSVKENISSALANMKRSFSSAFAKTQDSPTAICRDTDKSKPNKQRKLDSFILTPDSDKTTWKDLNSPKLSSPCKSSDTGIEMMSPCHSVTPDYLSQGTPTSMTSVSPEPRSPPTATHFSVVFEDPLSFTKITPTTTTSIDTIADRSETQSEDPLIDTHVKSVEVFAGESKASRTEDDTVIDSGYSLHRDLEGDSKEMKMRFDENCISQETTGETDTKYNNNKEFLSCDHKNSDSKISRKEEITRTSQGCGSLDSAGSCLDVGSELLKEGIRTEGSKSGHRGQVSEDGVTGVKNLMTKDHSEYTVTITEKDEPFDERHKRKEKRVPFSMAHLRSRLEGQEKQRSLQEDKWCRSFRAKINPTDNTAAEEELKREISKDMFLKMKILGQFNLGFIIALLDRDLFIIDQHATDEKYNFEMLQRHTVIQSQKLIQPQVLELTAASEAILMDNLEIFHKNGFDFHIDEEAPPTQRVKLVSMPVSKNWTFGKDDIDELLFMLSDSPGVHCRPSRVRMMFASRSCRKAVMIGTALDKPQMRKLVDHMSEIEQPWNCPHGRPTMRHLINLDMLPH